MVKKWEGTKTSQEHWKDNRKKIRLNVKIRNTLLRGTTYPAKSVCSGESPETGGI